VAVAQSSQRSLSQLRPLRPLRRLAFAQVGASCLSRLRCLSYLMTFTEMTVWTAEKYPQMSALSGFGGGFCAHKKSGAEPRLPRLGEPAAAQTGTTRAQKKGGAADTALPFPSLT